MNLTQVIKDEARHLGFVLAGVTTPDPPPHGSAYERWLALGRHAQMDYLAEERSRSHRLDPRLVLPSCESILMLAVRYPDPRTVGPFNEQDPVGRIASYAWGIDYHLVLPKRLEALSFFISRQVGFAVSNRWYTDTGPVMERDLAQRAGLGWIGKNTCLINPRLGSYFLLAEILLGIELDPDPPFEADRCGTCRRCIEACPTGCILPDRTMDARRCISYLTIENKGAIPSDLRPAVGNWIFGCDLCQMVCPWNQRAERGHDQTFSPQQAVPYPDLILELALTPQEFNHKFKENPVQRARRRGYLRNVAVVLGNAGDPAAIPALERALMDNEPLVREHAAWALDQLKGRS